MERSLARLARCAGLVLALLLHGAISFAAPIDDAKTALRQRDYAKAAALLRTAADANDPQAQYLLATLYRQGQGVERNPKAAFNWMRRAAELGNVQAQYALGVMYLDGIGTAIDNEAARKWLGRAADAGHPLAGKKLQQPVRERKSAPSAESPPLTARRDDTTTATSPADVSERPRKQKATSPTPDVEHRGPATPVSAARAGQLPLLRKLVRGSDDLERTDESGATPMTAAAAAGRDKAIGLLVKLGANVDAPDRNGDRALVLAAGAGHRAVVEALLAANVQVNLTDQRGDTAAIAAARNGQLAILRRLIEREADLSIANRDHCNPLCAALAANQGRIADYLRTQRGAASESTMSVDATRKAAEAMIAESRDPASPYAGWPPHAIAAWRGQDSILVDLLAHDADVNARDGEGYTALLRAASAGHAAIITLLAAHGADPDIHLDDKRGPLSLAVHNGHDEAVNALLKSYPAIARSGDGGAALLEASKVDDTSAMVALLDKGVGTSEALSTALVTATRARNPQMLEVLLRHGASISGKDIDGRTALWWASDLKWRPGARLLLQHDAPVNLADAQGHSPLLRCALRGEQAMLIDLLHAGANVNATSLSGDSALIVAAEAGNTAIVRELLRAGAVVDVQNGAGDTALMRAAANGHDEIVGALLVAGADTRLINKLRLDARMLADQGKHASIVARLDQHDRENSILHRLWTQVAEWF